MRKYKESNSGEDFWKWVVERDWKRNLNLREVSERRRIVHRQGASFTPLLKKRRGESVAGGEKESP